MSPYDSHLLTRRDALKLAAALPFAGIVGPMPTWAGQATPVPVPAAEIAELVAGNTAFAFDLYAGLRDAFSGNLLISPYSISEALAMTYAGARGETARQMTDALSFTLDQPALHESFGDLNNDLVARGNAEVDDDPRTLAIANALWVEQTYPLVPAYTALLERYYGSALNQADFVHRPEETREEINTWVEDRTEHRIQDIVSKGRIDEGTKLVLANAIYFYGAWQSAFDPADTRDEAFFRLGGSTVTVPMMYQVADLPYAFADGYQVVELPYAESGLALTVILPDEGRFEEVEGRLDGDMLMTAIEQLVEAEVHLSLPKFELTTPTMVLNHALISLGMPDAFDPMRADFTGAAEQGLFITYVLHKTFIGVDERGTEAAAATIVIMGSPTAMAPIEVRIDRPFLFAIRDTVTGTLLFLGRVLDPNA